MIYMEWSAVTGYVYHKFTVPEYDSIVPPPRDTYPAVNHKSLTKSLFKTLGVTRNRDSKGNHQWVFSQIRKELKKKSK